MLRCIPTQNHVLWVKIKLETMGQNHGTQGDNYLGIGQPVSGQGAAKTVFNLKDQLWTFFFLVGIGGYKSC